MCLVPGYKEAFQNILNTNNFTLPKENVLPEPTTSLGVVILNTTYEDSTQLVNIIFGNNITKEFQKEGLNCSLSPNFGSSEICSNILSKDVRYSDVKSNYSTIDSIAKDSLVLNTSVYSQEIKLTFQNHHKFLLMRNDLDEFPLQSNLSRIYETFRNSDVSKVFVQLLQEKLKVLNENDQLIAKNVRENVYSTTTTRPNNNTKNSKWNIVREFFLDKHKSGKGNLKQTFPSKEINLNGSFTYQNQNNFTNSIKDSKSVDTVLDLKDFFDQFYGGTIDLTHKVEGDYDPQSAADGTQYDSTLEFYNINLPYDIDKIDELNKPLMKDKNTTNEPEESKEVIDKNETLTEHANLTSEELNSKMNISEKSNQPGNKSDDITSKRQSWKTMLWPVIKYKPTKPPTKLINILACPKKNKFSSSKKPFKITEKFLLNMNSKNFSELEVLERSQNIKNHLNENDYSKALSSESSSESASSMSEDLYNNSIVFIVHTHNTTDLNKATRWNRILNFFHIAKAIPCPEGGNPCTDSSKVECISNKLKYNEFPRNILENTIKPLERTTQETIYLPESLMPDSLAERQISSSSLSSSWTLEDCRETKICK